MSATTGAQERLFCAIEVPLPVLGDAEPSKFQQLLVTSKSAYAPGRRSGWVPLLHITLYFFQHDRPKPGDPVWTESFIKNGLESPSFDVKNFPVELSKIIFCGTRTLRLKVEDVTGGLQMLHHKIVEALQLPPFEGGWEGGHVSLYRFNNSEQKDLVDNSQNSSVQWIAPLVEAYQNINYTFTVSEFHLYRSEPSGYVKLATFKLH